MLRKVFMGQQLVLVNNCQVALPVVRLNHFSPIQCRMWSEYRMQIAVMNDLQFLVNECIVGLPACLGALLMTQRFSEQKIYLEDSS